MKVNSVCIVGGGSSGWMTAALLAYNLPDLKITVVEPRDIPTVGVGESTLGHINRYLDCIGLTGRDAEWMPECDATYKVSIQFTDFKHKGHRFQYPFGQMDFTDNAGTDDWDYLSNIYSDVRFDEFNNPITYLADNNRMTDNSHVIRNFNFTKDTAYHFDATKFGNYLKETICIPKGVKVVRDSVVKVFRKTDGTERVDFLQLENSPMLKIEADLFVDCTGFKSLLLEEEMGSKFISFNDVLLNDTALAARIPFVDKEKEVHNTTDCHALLNGWVWNIPLWSRIGTGYCYSSKFTTDERAEGEFRRHLAKSDPKRAEEAEFFKIDIRHGKREKAWVKNVVGIGLSYGFLEPLESTGLLTTHENALRLLATLEKRNGLVKKPDIDGYNLAVDQDLESMKGFVAMHYFLSERKDSPYWRYLTEEIDFPNLMDYIVRTPRLYQEYVYSTSSSNNWGSLDGLLYIAAGMGCRPLGKTECNYRIRSGTVEKGPLRESYLKHIRYKDQVLKKLQSMPTTYEYLRDHVYFPKKKTNSLSLDE